MNTVFHNSRTYSCGVDFFRGSTGSSGVFIFLPHLSNFIISAKNQLTSLILIELLLSQRNNQPNLNNFSYTVLDRSCLLGLPFYSLEHFSQL